MEIIVAGGRTRTAPFGLKGGKPGAKAKHVLIDEQNNEKILVSKASPVRLKPNSKVAYMPAGGGGIGDPLNRVPDSVLEDVKNGYVSLNAAKREYGVVIFRTDPGGYLINRDATEKYRKTRKES